MIMTAEDEPEKIRRQMQNMAYAMKSLEQTLGGTFKARMEQVGQQVQKLADEVNTGVVVYSDPAPQNFEAFARATAREHPLMSVERMLALYDNKADFTLDSVESCGRWVLSRSDIVALIRTPGKKIQAIKETRAGTNIGLKEAKDAVEWAETQIRRGWLSPEEADQLRREEEAAIRSILGSPSDRGEGEDD